MRLAELFVELSFKVNGAEDLTKFDDQMKSVASSARDALAALRALARVKLPKEFIPKGGNGGRGGTSSPNGAPGSLVSLAQGGPTSARTVIQSAQIIINSAKIAVMEGTAAGAGGNGGRGGVIPSAAGDDGGVGKLGKFGLAALGFGTVLAAIRGLASGLREMVQTTRQAAFATDKLTGSTGLSRRELKQWEYVATKANLGDGVIQNTLQRLTENREAMRYGRGNFTPFAQFGIDWTADAGTQLRQFFQRTKGDTQAQAEQKAQMLGIDPTIVYARKYLDQSGNLPRGAELSDKEQGRIMELNSAWQDMTFNAGVLAQKISGDVAPAFKYLVTVADELAKKWSADPSNRSVFLGGVPGLLNPSGLGDMFQDTIDALLPKMPWDKSAAIPNQANVNMTFHGVKDAAVPGLAGRSVSRVISDAGYQVAAPQADR